MGKTEKVNLDKCKKVTQEMATLLLETTRTEQLVIMSTLNKSITADHTISMIKSLLKNEAL